MKFSVTILGCSSATPTTERNPSSQLINHNEKFFLIDCGEGTQVQLRRNHLRFIRIDYIFISHLHGDHFFGLVGLISTMHLLGRKKGLHIYAPPELEEVILLQLRISTTALSYPLHFHAIQAETPVTILENNYLEVITLPLSHKIPTTGFIFREKPGLRSIHDETVKKYGIPFKVFEALKSGSDYTTSDGKLILNEELTRAPAPSRSYVYCSDTAYYEAIIPAIEGADMLYHETTFMADKAAIAAEKFHSTTVEAATIALKARVKKLLIGHYSARYDDLQPLLDESRAVFPETYLTRDGMVFDI
jgi:ribonuclease Z